MSGAAPGRDRETRDDREARRLAQSELDRPLVLEAGAGTGKTTTLVARALAWCLGKGWERSAERLAGSPEGDGDERVAARVLQGLTAITFTEAAAAEMAERVGRELAGVAGGGELPPWLDPPPVEAPLYAAELYRRRAHALVSTLDHLTVSTIHAWCLKLLAAHPLDAGLHPHLIVDADGRRLEEIVRETVEGRLRQAYGEKPDETFVALAARGFGPAEIAGTLLVLVAEGLPAEALEADPLGPGPVSALAGRAAAACGALHALLAPRLGVGRLQKAREVEAGLAAAGKLLEEARQAAPDEALARLRRLPEILEGGRGRIREWRRGLKSQAEREALGEVRAELAAVAAVVTRLLAHLEALDPELLALGHRALPPLLAAVREEMRARGVVTFHDLLAETAALLIRRPAVARRVRRGIDQLLVDELQDTDPLQYQILGRIALEGPPEERPGLFLVGDPKQSIYGWRNADLAAYEGFVERVEAGGGLRRALSTNFRSVPPVLEEVGRLVAPVMHQQHGLQPAFEPLLACERLAGETGFAAGGRAPVEHWVSWRRDDGEGGGLGRTRSGDADEVEAAALARDLAELHRDHGVPWPEMALLFRSTTGLEPYLDALRRADVPFQVSGDKQYYRRREVIDAAALVRAVLDPGDQVALVTLLRSPMVGVPDAAWLPLWRRELPRLAAELGPGCDDAQHRRQLDEIAGVVREAAAEVPREVPGIERLRGWDVSLLAALEHLAVARRRFREGPADVFVATLRDLFLPEPVEAARYLGAYRLANLERFFALLGDLLEEAEAGPGAVLRLLRRSVAGALEAGEGLPQQGADDAVRVMTLHGAKGLEFDHVYLPQLHRRSEPPGRPATEVARDGEAGGGDAGRSGWQVRLFGAPSLGFDLADAERQAVEAAERVRLLYVAATRARKRLVLLGCWPARVSSRPPEAGRSLLDLVLARPERPGEPGKLWEELAARGEAAASDAAGALWRFSALEERAVTGEGPASAAEAPGAGLPGAGEVRRGEVRLAQDRRRAVERQERPFQAAASEEAHDRLRELLADPEWRQGDRGERGSERAVRLAVGTAVHALLERCDPAAEPGPELARLRGLLDSDLARRLPASNLEAGRRRAGEILDRFAAGPLLGRLAEIAPGILARELAVLLPPLEEGGEGAPVGYVAGSVDLLYRDPADGALVVADYKTDEVEGDEEIAARAAAYAPQGEVYRRAVTEALGLASPPRFELWFLHPGVVV